MSNDRIAKALQLGASEHYHHRPVCHPERSEGSLSSRPCKQKTKTEILRYAQNDKALESGGSVKMRIRGMDRWIGA